MVEKQGIINLSNSSYAYVVLSDFDVTFLDEEKDATFYPFFY